MCYFSSISVGFKIIETRFGARFVQSEQFKPVYSASAFTFPRLPVITSENPDQIDLFNWGLIPFWIKDETAAGQIKQQTINARAETVFVKPSFRHSAATKRCLVLVNGFFEWRHFEKQRYPYYIGLPDHEPFALAGIWDLWINRRTEEEIKTFSIITTQANPLLEQIHNIKKRMPVVLSRETERNWLYQRADKKGLEALLKPYAAGRLNAFTVDRAISRLGLNTEHPAVLIPKEYAGLPAVKD
ncbi:MAG TPA: SOS response-associated peptidase [Dehalococcoidales bacterium]|nr:SOS response-associated peptidase [Dehalococcoidales bacterium]